MHPIFRSRIFALLAFVAIAALGIRAIHESAGRLEGEYPAQSSEIEHLGCNFGHRLSPCGFDAYPAGDLFIVEPSFG
jgi:hypothetical protein